MVVKAVDNLVTLSSVVVGVVGNEGLRSTPVVMVILYLTVQSEPVQPSSQKQVPFCVHTYYIKTQFISPQANMHYTVYFIQNKYSHSVSDYLEDPKITCTVQLKYQIIPKCRG